MPTCCRDSEFLDPDVVCAGLIGVGILDDHGLCVYWIDVFPPVYTHVVSSVYSRIVPTK